MAETAPTDVQGISVKSDAATESPTRLILRRFRKSKSGLVGGVILLFVIVVTLLAPVLAPFDPSSMRVGGMLEPPSWKHLMGTDQFGRDIASRILWGGRSTLPVGFVAVTFGFSIGVSLGLVAGYLGGRIESFIMRFVDVMLAFPGILLALFIIAILGEGMFNLMIAIGIASIPLFVRVTRGTVLSAKELEYVQAARSIGSSGTRVMFRHILPNVLAAVMVLATLRLATAIISAAALSYLGLGVQPPTPEWGKMLSEGQDFILFAWWLVFFPGISIVITVFAMNLFGDGLRDALDPRMKPV